MTESKHWGASHTSHSVTTSTTACSLSRTKNRAIQNGLQSWDRRGRGFSASFLSKTQLLPTHPWSSISLYSPAGELEPQIQSGQEASV